MGALATKPACPYAFMRAAMAFAFVLALALISPAVAFAETYAHGHLRYEVADQSVTITGYAGHEEIVTVPSMIGGNPVNSIASGAFSTAASVETVYLPSTVVSVEQGAFAPSQAVVHGLRPSEEEGILGPSNPMAVAIENTVSVDEATVGEEATDVEGDPTEPGTQPGTAPGARHLQPLDEPHLMTFRFMRRGLTD